MATNKTLSPTNVTIAIPAMGDAPDASVFSNCIDKEADAINTLNSQITVATKSNATANTTYCSSVPPYVKMGKICIISGDAVVTDAIPSNNVYVLGTGYPSPQVHDSEWTYWGVMIDRSGGSSYRVNISASGLRVAYNAIPTGNYSVFVCYFCQ